MRPLSRYRAALNGRPIDVRASDFTQEEAEVLRRWAPPRSIREHRPVEQLALDLVATPVNLETRVGRKAYAALRDLRHIHPFADDVLQMLVRDFGTRHLAKTRFLYNGHSTEAMFPLFPTLHALGIKGASMVGAPQSGSGAMHRLMQMQLSKNEKIVRVEAYSDHRTDKSRYDAAALQKMKALAEKAAANGEMLIVDKGGLLAHHLDDRLRALIRNGTIRFIVHNKDDVDTLLDLKDEAYMIDVASSPMKALEARIIGEQYALLGMREAR